MIDWMCFLPVLDLLLVDDCHPAEADHISLFPMASTFALGDLSNGAEYEAEVDIAVRFAQFCLSVERHCRTLSRMMIDAPVNAI